MKSKIIWQWTALFSISLFFIGCKKEIKQIEANKLTQENGTSSPLGITCIANSIHFLKTESLSQARGSIDELDGPLGIGLANKILVVGGDKNNKDISEHVDIYNTTTDSWTVKILSSRRNQYALAAAGTKIGIAGGENLPNPTDRVDIYDVSSDVWTVSHLSSPRQGVAGVGYGDSLYFAGGELSYGGSMIVKTVDIYSTPTGAWSLIKLPHARMYAAAAATNNKIVFAGGVTGKPGFQNVTNTADIYDVSTGTWSTGHLSLARERLTATALGNLIIFAGGDDANDIFVNTIDIYNTTTGTWVGVQPPNAPYGRVQSAAQGTKMFFGRQGNSSGPAIVIAYDICSNTWTNLSLSDGRGEFAIGAAGGKVLFGGGSFGGSGSFPTFNPPYSKAVDIFYLSTLLAQ